MINTQCLTRELTVIRLNPSPDDPLYTGCLWMTVYIDATAWRLMVDSDCGAYTHCWPNEDDLHTFGKALAGYLMDEDYILSKISKRSAFDPEGTREIIKEYVDDPDVIEQFADAETEHDFWTIINDVDDQIDLYECMSYEYPIYARRVAMMLKKYIAPILRSGSTAP